jgi:Tol biopolymer transport system component
MDRQFLIPPLRPACLALPVALAFAVLSAPASAQEPDPAVLLERARYEEGVRGDLEAAIRIYQSIVADFPRHRGVAAQALLALGGAYERIGREGAHDAYARIVAEYADQVEEADAARSRLAALTPRAPTLPPDPGGLALRRLWTTPVGLSVGALSPDARRVLFVDWGSLDDPTTRGHADVATYDLAEERVSLVTDLPDQSIEDTYPDSPIWSRDGARIAYAHWDGDWTHKRLHLVRRDGTDNRVLVDNEQFRDLRPLAFSSTGDFIVTLLLGWDEAYRIGLVSTEDGSVTILKTSGRHPPHPLSLSPDDRYIVFDQHQGDGSPRHDIFALAVDGSSEATLVRGAAEDHLPFWTPGGDAIVFVSDRSGRPALWSLPVKDGRPAGEPRMVRDHVGDMYPMGFTADGALVYRSLLWRTDVFTADLDLPAGRMGEPRILTSSFVGGNMLPAWGPAGERVAFVSRRGRSGDAYHLVVRHVRSGVEEAHPLPFSPPARVETTWSEDGAAVYLDAGTGADRISYRVRLATGEVERVERRDFIGRDGGQNRAYANERQMRNLRSLGIRVAGQNEINAFREGDMEVAPGEDLVWVRNGVRRFRDGVDGEPEALTVLGHAHTWHLSPDGQTWAVAISTRPETEVSDALFVLPASDGAAREIARTEGGEREILAIRWTPDGERILFAEGEELEDAPFEYWIVSKEGGEPQRLDLDLTPLEFAGMRLRPDGGAIAFTREQRLRELWLMDGAEW